MGRMQDALKKAAEERERKRFSEGAIAAPPRESPDLEFHREVEDRAIHAPPVGRHRTGEQPRPTGPRVTDGPDERLVVLHATSDERSEEFRKIRANLLSLEPRPTTIMLTSGAPGEGKSVMAANLALSMLEMEACEVLLVDANLRHPELAGLLGTPDHPGLSDVITTEGQSLDAAIVKTKIPGLSLLPAGSGGVTAARQLQPDVLKGILDRVRSRFGFVIVDTPATCDYADAVLMSNDVDGVLVVVKIGEGRRTATTMALDALEGSKARILGTVVMTGA